MTSLTKRIVLLLAAGGLLLAACGQEVVVASVDGVPIERGAVAALRHSYMTKAAVSGERYRRDLSRMILLQALRDAAAADFGTTGLEDPARARDKIADPAGDEARIFDSIRSDPDNTEAQLELVARLLVLRDTVIARLLQDDPGYLENLLAEHPEEVTQVCVRHVLTVTREEADAARARLDAGEDFATVVADVSVDDRSPGGALPCPLPASAFAQPFGADVARELATTPIGGLVGPVRSDMGWHVLIVDSRTAPGGIEELRADPLRYVDAAAIDAVWKPWLDTVATRAVVTVRSEVGTWAGFVDGITPPPGG